MFVGIAILIKGNILWKLVGIIFIGTFSYSLFYGYTYARTMDNIYITDWKYDMSAFTDNRDINGQYGGSVFMSRGYISQDMFYYFIVNTVKGKKMMKISSNSVFLDDSKIDVQPIVYCGHYDYREKTFLSKFLGFEYPESTIYQECYMIVPKGTIADNYKIDLQ